MPAISFFTAAVNEAPVPAVTEVGSVDVKAMEIGDTMVMVTVAVAFGLATDVATTVTVPPPDGMLVGGV
jgi:hypothetical protein